MTATGPRTSHAVDAVLMGVALVWGSSYLVAKDLTTVAPVVVVLALRYVISSAALALASTVFAFLAQTWAIRRTSPSRASLLMGTEPVWAVAVGISVGGEGLTATGAVGAVLILAAVFFGQHVEQHHRLPSHVPTQVGSLNRVDTDHPSAVMTSTK